MCRIRLQGDYMLKFNILTQNPGFTSLEAPLSKRLSDHLSVRKRHSNLEINSSKLIKKANEQEQVMDPLTYLT